MRVGVFMHTLVATGLYIHYQEIAEIEVAIKGPFLGLALEFGH